MRDYLNPYAIGGQNYAPPPPIRNPLTKATPLDVLRAQALAAARKTLPPAGWSNYVFAVIWDGFPLATAFNHQDKDGALHALFEWLDPDPYGPPAGFLYGAVFDATDPRWPRPIDEATGPGYLPIVIPQGKPTMPATWRLREAAKVRSGGWPWWPMVGQEAVRRTLEAAQNVPPTPPPPLVLPWPLSSEHGRYFFPTSALACGLRANWQNIQGCAYSGYTYGRYEKSRRSVGDKIEVEVEVGWRRFGDGAVFVGTNLALNHVYFVLPVSGTSRSPTGTSAYFWMRRGSEWSYLGELPVAE